MLILKLLNINKYLPGRKKCYFHCFPHPEFILNKISLETSISPQVPEAMKSDISAPRVLHIFFSWLWLCCVWSDSRSEDSYYKLPGNITLWRQIIQYIFHFAQWNRRWPCHYLEYITDSIWAVPPSFSLIMQYPVALFCTVSLRGTASIWNALPS